MFCFVGFLVSLGFESRLAELAFHGGVICW